MRKPYWSKMDKAASYPHWGHLIGGLDGKKAEFRESLDLLARAVHLDISPIDSEDDLRDIVTGISKVAEALL